MGSAQAIRVGVIGAGANTRSYHIPKLLAIPGVSVVAVANRSEESAAAVAAQFKIPKATANWRELIDSDDIDAIVIGTWPYMHRTLVIEALRAGKHVLTEARMAMNASEAHEMLQASLEYPHLVAQIVPSPFTFPFDKTIQDILSSGVLGTLNYVSVTAIGTAFPEPSGAPLHWRHNAQYSGVNIGVLGIFYEALQRWVGDAVRVTALGKTVVKARTDPATGALSAVKIPDHVDILAELAIGANAHIVVSAATGAAKGPTRAFVIYGSEGTLQLEIGQGTPDQSSGTLQIALKAEGGVWKDVEITEEKRGRWRVEEEFIGAIRGSEKIKLTDFTTGVRYMEFTEAVSRSWRTGNAVLLPLSA